MTYKYFNALTRIIECLGDSKDHFGVEGLNSVISRRLNWDYNAYKKLQRVINRNIDRLKKGCAIFPYGIQGKIARYILEKEYGILPKYIVDNGLAGKEEGVISLGSLKNGGVTVLLCSDREDIYHEIRKEICKFVLFEHIIDAMSPSAYFDPDIYFEPSVFRLGDYQYPRISALELASREIYQNHVYGAIAEVGVYKGVFASCMNRLFPDREFHLFDTFEGFDDRDIDDNEIVWSGEFREVSPLDDSMEEEVLNLIDYKRGIIHKGYFPETTKGIPDKKYAFVSLDTDLYKPIKAGLEYYWPRMSNGGYIFVDDYGHKYLQGVNQAVSEFVREHHVSYARVNDGVDSTAILQKPLVD